MSQIFKRLIVGEEGATMVEYALMVALVAAAAVTAVGALSTAINGQFTGIGTTITGTS